MNLPIIISENGDVDVFNSVEAVEMTLEAIDVNQNAYQAYDSKGNLLKLSTKWGKNRYYLLWFLRLPFYTEEVYVSELDPVQNYAEELREILISYLSGTRWNKDEIIHLTLDELIQKMPRRS